MKYLKQYSELNESIKDSLKPKLENDVKKELDKLNTLDRFYRIATYDMWYLYSEDDIKNMCKKIKPYDKIIIGSINNIT